MAKQQLSRLRQLLIRLSLILGVILGVLIYRVVIVDFKIIKRQTAALKGVNWLMNNQDRLGALTGLITYRKLYKVVADDKLADKLAKMAKKKSETLDLRGGEIKKLSQTGLDWDDDLLPLVEEMLVKKCRRFNLQLERDRLEQYLKMNEDRVLSKKLRPSGRLVAAYLLGELGIENQNLYRDTVEELEGEQVEFSEPLSRDNLDYLYGLTHVVLTASDYYSQKLDSEKYSDEIRVFKQFLEYVNGKKIIDNDQTLDILAEVVVSMKLLGQESNNQVRAASNKLIKAQNADGSWGMSKLVDSGKIHHTLVVSLALLNFAEEFRQVEVYCPVY